MTSMLRRFGMNGNFRQVPARVFGVAAAAVGGGHLAAWLAGVMGQRGLGTITMKTNAALCLLLAGTALVLLASPALQSWRRWLVKLSAGTVVLIAALTLGENLAGWDLGIDQLLATEAPGALGVIDPNRMGMPACVSFILAGASLLILATPRTRARRIVLAQGLALVICLITLLSTLGFLYDAHQLHALAPLTAIAWPTAIAILGLGIGLLFARPSEGFMAQMTANDAGGASIRRLLIPAILLPLGLGWLRLAGERAGLYDPAIGTALVMLAFIVVFTSFVYWAGRRTSQSSAALMESERQFRIMGETVPFGVWLCGPDGGVRYCSQSFLDLIDMTLEEQQQFGWTKRLVPEDVEPMMKKWLACCQAGTPWDHEHRMIDRNGEIHTILSRGLPVRDAEGEISCWVGVNLDITERKKGEEAERESERRYRTLFNAIDEGFCVIEMIFDENQKPIDYRFLDLNPAFVKQTGLVDAQGKTMRELRPLHEDHWFEIYGRIALTGQPARFENQAAQLHRWYDVYAFRFGRPEDRQVAVLFNDISERKGAEEALRESEERFRTLADNSPVILWMTNAQGGNQFVNRTYREFFGVSIEEVAGGNWHPLLHPDDVENYLRTYLTAVQNRTSFTTEARVRRADGAWRWITSHADPRFTPSGEFLGHVGISPDITERKQAEEELREINRTLEQRVAERTAEAEQRAEELRALAGELARTERREQRRLAQWLHDDLQQLLVATKMQIAVAQTTTSEEDFRQLLQKASRLIDESIGRARSMTAELCPPILHESGLIAGLEQLSRWIEEKHALHVTVETTAQINPENQEAAVVLFGATRELLFNVVKHAGVNEALVRLTEQDGRIRLTVEDGGIGFDPALVRDGAKSGFGLLNVRERLRSIGGDFRVQTAPGQGTRITLLAPARPAEAPVRPAPASTESPNPS